MGRNEILTCTYFQKKEHHCISVSTKKNGNSQKGIFILFLFYSVTGFLSFAIFINSCSDTVLKNISLFQLGALSALSTGVQLLAGSKILSMLTGIPFWIMTVIMAVIAYSYSQFSGIKASILTDSIQMAFMLIASVCFAVFGIKNGGGIQNMFAGIGGYTGECSSLFSAKGIEIFLGFGLPTTVGLILSLIHI